MHGRNDKKGSDECGLVDALRTFVEESDLSLPKIANRMEVFSATLSMWIAGTSKPSCAQQVAIKEFLGQSDQAPDCPGGI
jgi:DNA transposition AAA+ family ATPase